jgi:hypothetical protein
MSSVTPAYISARPPKGSIASWWNQVDTVDNLFQIFSYSAAGGLIAAAVGTVVEVDFEYVMNALGGAPTTLGVAAGVLGQFYYPTLDSSGSKAAYPVGLPSTI